MLILIVQMEKDIHLIIGHQNMYLHMQQEEQIDQMYQGLIIMNIQQQEQQQMIKIKKDHIVI